MSRSHTGSTLAQLARVVPAPVRSSVKEFGNRLQTMRARQRFEGARLAAKTLDIRALEILQRRYRVNDVNYDYSPADRLARGKERRAALEAHAPKTKGTSLEIGSADAMTSAELARAGWKATGIDIDITRTDVRATAAGVDIQQMDATRLLFPDLEFDLVFSFNVFEHLPDPASTFSEIVRVLKPGGVAYISFTGLRWSPHGAHMYKVINVPYITVLFEEAAVLAYLREKGLPDTFPWVNEYSIERFRKVFRGHASRVDTLHYEETWNRWHTDLIGEHPGVFKARAPSFDSLLVDSVHARFKRL